MAEPSNDRTKWDRAYTDDEACPQPARVLSENAHLLPSMGVALDFACGLGGNALLLARQGLATHAFDISPVAIDKLKTRALSMGVPLRAEVRDVNAMVLPPQSFDVIVVCRFLERALAGPIMQLLRPGGLLFYQTFTREKVTESGPKNPAYRLAENELLALFAALRLRVYREEGVIGDQSKGFRNQAMLVGQRV